MTTATISAFAAGPVRSGDGYRQRPPSCSVGQGSWLTDSEGRRYLDFIQGWAVNCLGHCRRAITQALARRRRS